MLIAFINVPLGLLHGLMGVAIGAESVTVPLQVRLKYRLMHLMQGLLDNPVGQRWDAEHPLFAVRLGYFHTFDWAGLLFGVLDITMMCLLIQLTTPLIRFLFVRTRVCSFASFRLAVIRNALARY